MGRRKTKKIKQSKSSLALRNRNKIDREFHCNKCQHDRSVSVKIDMKSAIGFLKCRICGVDFSTRITSLDEPIDVYTSWIDELREKEKLISMAEQTKSVKQDHKESPKHTYEKPPVDDEVDMLSHDDDQENTFDATSDIFDAFKNQNDTSVNFVDNLNKSEPGDSSPNYGQGHSPTDDFSKSGYNSEDEFLNITKTRFTNRVIGAGDLSSSFEVSENPDTHVHNLFQDED